MNPILKALDEVKYRIPEPILKETFKEQNYNWRKTPVSIDEQITNKVIRSRVMVDCNLTGGTEALIPLEGLSPEIIDSVTAVYHIPKDRTQNRTILSAKSVGYMSFGLAYTTAGLGTVNPYTVNDVLSAGNAVMNSFSSTPPVSTAKVQLIAENTIMIRDINHIVSNNYLRAIVANDENMNHLQMRSIPAFCKLVELAVKSYIYNTLVIRMDQAYLSGGQELGSFKNMVENYADAEQMYQDYLRDQWQAVSFMNDTESVNRFLKLMIGGMK